MKNPFFKLTLFILFLSTVTCVFGQVGYLKIKAQSGSINILVDGKDKGEANNSWVFFELTTGKHVITAEKKHYQSQRKEVFIEKDKVVSLIFEFKEASGYYVTKPTESNLIKGYGDLTIITDKPGATVKLNGVSINDETTPLTVNKLAEGDWQVEVNLLGKSMIKNITIRANQIEKINFFFDESNEAEYNRKIELEKEERNKRIKLEEENRKKEIQKKLVEDRIKILENKTLYEYEIKRKSYWLKLFIPVGSSDKKFYSSDWVLGNENRKRDDTFLDNLGNTHKIVINVYVKGDLSIRKYYLDIKFIIQIDNIEDECTLRFSKNTTISHFCHQFETKINQLRFEDFVLDYIQDGYAGGYVHPNAIGFRIKGKLSTNEIELLQMNKHPSFE